MFSDEDILDSYLDHIGEAGGYTSIPSLVDGKKGFSIHRDVALAWEEWKRNNPEKATLARQRSQLKRRRIRRRRWSWKMYNRRQRLNKEWLVKEAARLKAYRLAHLEEVRRKTRERMRRLRSK